MEFRLKSFLNICLVFLIGIFCISPVSANSFSDLFDEKDKLPYCDDAGECGWEEGIDSIKTIDDIETERSASQYIQDIVSYVLTFLGVVSVIIIIYGGFLILTSGGDDDKVSKGKNFIIYALIGLVVIFLAYSIVVWFIQGILNGNSGDSFSSDSDIVIDVEG